MQSFRHPRFAHVAVDQKGPAPDHQTGGHAGRDDDGDPPRIRSGALLEDGQVLVDVVARLGYLPADFIRWSAHSFVSFRLVMVF